MMTPRAKRKFSIVKTAETTESRIDIVGNIGSSHNYNVGSSFYTVYEGEQLRENSSLTLTVRLLTIKGDGIDIINKDDTW